MAYLRLTTNPRLFDPPAEPTDAWQRIIEWLALRSVWIPEPGPGFARAFSEIVTVINPTGNLIPDAYLAALAREHSLTVASSDRGFVPFAEAGLIELVNPIEKDQ